MESKAEVIKSELVQTIKKVAGFKGLIVWDTSKPDGQMKKIFDATRLPQLGLRCPTLMDQGLGCTVKWFLQARKEGVVRL